MLADQQVPCHNVLVVDLSGHRTAELMVPGAFQSLEMKFPVVPQMIPCVEVNHGTGLEVEIAVLTFHLKVQGVLFVHQSGLAVVP